MSMTMRRATATSLFSMVLLGAIAGWPKHARAEGAPPKAPAAVGGCDVTIAPGQAIGVTPATEIPFSLVEPKKTYCVFGTKLTSASTLKDVELVAPKTCTKSSFLGGVDLHCSAEGISISFGGPPGVFSQFTVYPKGWKRSTVQPCEVVVPGERIGASKLTGATLPTPVDAAKTYCTPWGELTAKLKADDLKALLPKGCVSSELVGELRISCAAEGISFSFGGPVAVFSSISAFPKGKPPAK